MTVLTGKPNYPKGDYFPGYSFWGVDKESYNGAEIVRVPLVRRGKGGAVRLVLNYLSYVLFARAYIRKNRMVFDTIFCFEISPITQAFPALYCKKKYGGKVILWIQDLWPESVTAAGNIHNKTLLRWLEKMVKGIYEKCDVLLVQSEGFREAIVAKGDFGQKIEFVPNWAEDIYLQRKGMNSDSISAILPDGFRVMFAGNVGAAQDVGAIVEAAFETRQKKDIKWIIVGEGRARREVEQKAKSLGLDDSVFFLGRHPMSEMPTFFSYADVMIVSLRDEYIFSLTIPAKTQSYMASAKPIATMLNGEGNRIVEAASCGLTAFAGDHETLAKNVLRLYGMTREERERMGHNGLCFYQNNFDKKKIVDKIVTIMEA